MQIFYTYIHCKPDGTPFYVGKGSDRKGQRKRSHDLKNSRNPHYKSIVAKYGAENIGVFVFPCDLEEQAFADEIQQIYQLRKEGFVLSNLCDGGEGSSGIIKSLETKRKMALSQIGNKNGVGNKSRTGMKSTAETVAKMSMARKGRPAWNKGRSKDMACHIA